MVLKSLAVLGDWQHLDIALLKADLDPASAVADEKRRFSFIPIGSDFVSVGTEVYTFGYPLSDGEFVEVRGRRMLIGQTDLRPRLTSTIISATTLATGVISAPTVDPTYFTLDKSLAYGHSGGPVVARESGRAIALISEFEPLVIPQGGGRRITIPSGYSVATALTNIGEALDTLERDVN